ncbi:MAG: hypothetical protein KDE20_07765 [Caldilineaceae bacterium]|nr:hypothetical protein [Caldilineaceae bacterium]
MKRTLHFLPALIIALAAWFGFARPAAAACTGSDEPTPNLRAYDVACAAGVCTLDVPLELAPLPKLGAQIAIDKLENNLTFLPDGTTLDLTDSLSVKLPVGEILLRNADLNMTLGEDGAVEQLRGTAEVPLPRLGILENVALTGPVKADVGFERGANLADLNAPLDPDRQYMFIHFGSGLDLTADHVAADGETRTLAINIPQGQRATLIIDTEEPFAYLAGNLTLRYDEQLAFVGEWLSAADLASGIPLRHSVGVEFTGAMGENQPLFLRVGGSYAADAGLVGRWVGMDITPLAVHGVMTINDQGMLLDGVAHTEIFPETFMDGTMATQVFIPFEGELRDAYVKVDAQAEFPLAHATVEGTAMVNGALDVQARAGVTTPMYDNDGLVLVESDGDAATQRLARARDWAGGATDTVTRSFVYVRDGTGRGLDHVVDGVTWSAVAMGDGAAAGWDWTQARWCGVTGICGDGAATQADAIAQADATAEVALNAID